MVCGLAARKISKFCSCTVANRHVFILRPFYICGHKTGDTTQSGRKLVPFALIWLSEAAPPPPSSPCPWYTGLYILAGLSEKRKCFKCSKHDKKQLRRPILLSPRNTPPPLPENGLLRRIRVGIVRREKWQVMVLEPWLLQIMLVCGNGPKLVAYKSEYYYI